MSRREDFHSDPAHRVTVRILSGQVYRQQNFSATAGMQVRVKPSEAAWLERRGIAERV